MICTAALGHSPMIQNVRAQKFVITFFFLPPPPLLSFSKMIFHRKDAAICLLYCVVLLICTVCNLYIPIIESKSVLTAALLAGFLTSLRKYSVRRASRNEFDIERENPVFFNNIFLFFSFLKMKNRMRTTAKGGCEQIFRRFFFSLFFPPLFLFLLYFSTPGIQLLQVIILKRRQTSSGEREIHSSGSRASPSRYLSY